jgi:hypothetical protein
MQTIRIQPHPTALAARRARVADDAVVSAYINELAAPPRRPARRPEPAVASASRRRPARRTCTPV